MQRSLGPLQGERARGARRPHAQGRDRPHHRHGRAQARRRRWPTSPSSRPRASAARRIKDHVIAHLDHYLETFERNAVAAGAEVHWARTADEACRIVIEICRDGRRAPRDAREVDAGRGDRAAPCAGRGRHRAGRDRPRRAHHPARRRDALAHHLAGDAPHPRAGLGAVQGSSTVSRPQPRTSGAMVAERPARAAREVPHRRGRHLRRQLPDRRHRCRLHRHQRGQRRAHHHPAQASTSSPPGSRSWCRSHGARHGAAAPARPLGHRRRADPVHDLPLRPEAAGRRRRAGGDAHRPRRQRPLAMLGDGLARDAALHPLRRLHEPLRRLPPDRRPRLWRGLSRARWARC